MQWEEIEHIFNRSLRFSFSKKKFLFTFPILAICGLIAVICHACSLKMGAWVNLSLAFLPIFLSANGLLIAGIVLIRLYHHEVKGLPLDVRKTFIISKPLFFTIFQLSILMICAYLLLWMLLGIFYLFKAIPSIGDLIGAIFSFGPFLLVLGSLALGLLNLVLIFFATPIVALTSDSSPQVIGSILKNMRHSPFLSFTVAFVGLLPLLLTVGMLSLAAVVTDMMYVDAQKVLSVILQWLFMMLPFAALLTPVVVFFFNFSAESFVLIQRKTKQSEAVS